MEEAGLKPAAHSADGGRRARRQSMRRASSRRGGLEASAAAAIAAIPQDEDFGGNRGVARAPPERKPSWMNDVPDASLSDILGSAAAQEFTSQAQEEDDGDDVLDQYRLMAHHEARMRVKENCGFDISEYDKRRKLHPDPAKGEVEYKPRKITPLFPEPRLPSQTDRKLPKPQVPEPELALMPSRTKFRQRGRRTPDLHVGSILSSNDSGSGAFNATVSEGYHAVRCLGCRYMLQTKLFASLVRCPNCNTVSPASSTRR